MKTLGKMATALLLITAGFVHADAGRLAVSTPEGNMRQLFAVNEVDCHHVKGYLAQQTCFAEQQKWRAEQQTTIVQNDFTCERYHPSPQDHLHITVQDAVQETTDEYTYLYLTVKKDSRQKELPAVFVGDTLPNTFAALMADGSTRRLGDGKWLETKKRVASGESYRVRMTVLAAERQPVSALVCLAE